MSTHKELVEMRTAAFRRFSALPRGVRVTCMKDVALHMLYADHLLLGGSLDALPPDHRGFAGAEEDPIVSIGYCLRSVDYFIGAAIKQELEHHLVWLERLRYSAADDQLVRMPEWKQRLERLTAALNLLDASDLADKNAHVDLVENQISPASRIIEIIQDRHARQLARIRGKESIASGRNIFAVLLQIAFVILGVVVAIGYFSIALEAIR